MAAETEEIHHYSGKGVADEGSTICISEKLSTHGLFTEKVEPKANGLLKAVVEANPKKLIQLIDEDLSLFFMKGQVIDPAGRRFKDVSPFQLTVFLRDKYMLDDALRKIFPLRDEDIIDEKLQHSLMTQYSEVNPLFGGADLVKLNFEPNSLPFIHISAVCEKLKSTELSLRTLLPKFSLLSNPNGIILYQNQLYYAERDARDERLGSIRPIDLMLDLASVTHEEREQWKKFRQSLSDMENNSARRSTNDEHRLIQKFLSITLHRQGIEYEYMNVDGQCKQCRDVSHDFNPLINAYRKVFRLNSEKNKDGSTHAMIHELGFAQRDVLWLLQYYCDGTTKFNPAPDVIGRNLRKFEFSSTSCRTFGCLISHDDDLFGGVDLVSYEGKLSASLGRGFAIYKGRSNSASLTHTGSILDPSDVYVVNYLIESAKKDIVTSLSDMMTYRFIAPPREAECGMKI